MKIITLLSFLFLSTICFAQKNFTLTSPDVKGQATIDQVFNGFGCVGKNISPSLNWVNPPTGTKSFAITMYDPDAPTGSGWWQWVVFNIPADINRIVKNAGNPSLNLMPKGVVQSINNYGGYGYGGPCPPESGKIHAYIITIHALKVDKLPLTKDSNPAMVGFYINANTIEKATIVMNYQRNPKKK